MHSRLDNHLTKVDLDKGNQGVLTKAEFKHALQDFFSQRDEENIVMLIKAAESELDAQDVDTINYKSLFIQVGRSLSVISSLLNRTLWLSR